ncbi:virulence RhuM family protein [Patescibacteria group bacterium]|nr:virulence RhuM family protein [Patescibacteria group bacterium]
MSADFGEIILYETGDGSSAIDVQFRDETVWLSQKQMGELFDRDYKTISKHINNIFKEGELMKEPVVANFATTAADGKSYQVAFYNLDVIISVGYRVKSRRGTQFRIWASSVLKDYLVKGYSLNQKRLAEKGTQELRQVLSLLTNTLEGHELVNDEGKAVLDIVNRYAKTWQLLLQYDEDSLALPKHGRWKKAEFELDLARKAIVSLKKELLAKSEATELFGQERGDGLAGILGAICQTFSGRDLYPSVEEKAAHLLYFVIKDHPFSDGNKRIGSFLFVLYLEISGLLAKQSFDNKGLVALALLTATSGPRQKDILIRLIVNLVSAPNDDGDL